MKPGGSCWCDKFPSALPFPSQLLGGCKFVHSDPGIKRCDSDRRPPLQQGWLLAKELTRESLMLLLAGASQGGGDRTELEVK